MTGHFFVRGPAVARACHLFLALALAATLAACAVQKINLSQAELNALDVQSVDIRFAPDAQIWWGNAEREYAAKVTGSQTEPKARHGETIAGDSDAYRELMDSPGAKQYMRDKLTRMIQDRIGYTVHKYEGTRPVRLEVEVKGFVIPSPLQRLALGGNPLLAADTILRDVATGEVIGKLDRVAVGRAGAGIIGVAADQFDSDLEDRVLDNYYSNVANWLAGT
jgi:hypothetical protein